LPHTLTRDHLSVIGAVVYNGRHRGRLLMHQREKSFKSLGVVEFLKHLLARFSGRLLVIWDGSAIHHSREVKQFLAAGASRRLRLERLPGYAPELNPIEGVWRYLKRVELRNRCCLCLDHLRVELRRAMARLRHRKRVLDGCLRQPHLL